LSTGFGAQFGVQVAQRLIHQKHLGITGHRSPQRHPLLLTAGKLFREAIEQLVELERGRHLLNARLDARFAAGGNLERLGQAAARAVQAVLQLLGGAAPALAAQPEADVVGHGEVGIERVALKHHCHIPLGGPQRGDAAIPHKNLAAAGGLQAR